MIYPLLHEYLITKGNLPIPGQGLLTIDYESAYLQKSSNTVIAPTNDILFVPLEMQESDVNNLISFLSIKLNVTYEQANELLNQEAVAEVFQQKMGTLIKWPDSGRLRGNNTQTKALLRETFNDYLPSLSIEKIHRQPVSEPAFDAPQQKAMIAEEVMFESEEPVVKDYWWVWALVLFFLSVLLILFQFV